MNLNEAKFFPNQTLFRQWLINNHDKKTELIVGFYKVKSGHLSMTWSQSVDHALCFGWIDGVRKSIDAESYQIRFTPRKKASIWSQVNIDKIQKLTENGLMHPAGMEIYNNRTENSQHGYSSKKQDTQLPVNFENQFKQNQKAWAYFESLAPSYKKISINWVVSAVQDKTKHKRLAELIAMSELETNKWKDSKYKK